MKEFNEDAIARIEYRRNNLEEKLDAIRDSVSGLAESFLPRVTDENRNLDSEKLQKFVVDMVDGFNRYRVNVLKKEALPMEQEKLYKSFLYCVLVGPSDRSVLPDMSEVFDHLESAVRYRDIVTMAEGIFEGGIYERVERDMRAMQIIEETDELGYSGDPEFPYNEFFDLMNIGLDYVVRFSEKNEKNDESADGEPDISSQNQNISLKVLELIYSDCEHEIFNKIYADYCSEQEEKARQREELILPKHQEDSMDEKKEVHVLYGGVEMCVPVSDKPYEEDELTAENERLLNEMQEDMSFMDDVSDIPWVNPEEYDSWADREAMESWESAKCWYERMPDASRFISEYKEFRKLWFAVEHQDFAQDIRTMVDIYLYENEISVISMGGEYGLVDDQIRLAADRICRDIRRKRALWQ